MKKNLFILALAIAVSAFADEPIAIPVSPTHLKPPLLEVPTFKQGFFYIRFSTAETDLAHARSVLPGLGIGYRRLAGDGAADISINGIGRAERRNRGGRVFWTAPKTSYIHYLQPNGEKSAYVGGGLAWGGTDALDHDFVGIIPNATIGYEFVHKGPFLGFAELNISQPAIPLYRNGSFPGPIAELSAGVGF